MTLKTMPALLVTLFAACASLPAQAQGADCAAAAARCVAACTGKITGGLRAVTQCKAGCDAERSACAQRTSAAAPAPTAAAAAPDPKAARAALAGQRLGSHTLSVGPLLAAEGLRNFEVPQLDGVPLLDLTESQFDPSRIAVLRSFARAYAQARLDWTPALQAHYEPKEGGDGRGLIRHWLRVNQLVGDGKALEIDLANGLQGAASRTLEPEALRVHIPCAGVTPVPNTPCFRDEGRKGLTRFQGTNELERERARSAFVKDAAARLQRAFAPRTLSFYVLEQREVRDYDFQREVFLVRPRMTNSSALASPANPEAPKTTDVLGIPVALDRFLTDELRIPKAEAEDWLRKVSEHQPPGAQGRRVFSLARLDCQTSPVTALVAARCTLASAQLFADPALQVKLVDL
ncbi:MAG: DUF4852 domain-containing protein [Rubrivivax sp.]